MSLRFAVVSAFAAIFTSFGLQAFAQQSYPNRPIRLVVPFPAGGGSELLVRTIAGKISQSTGQPVVIDNKPGANGIVAEEFTARAAPDGYTVLLDTTAIVLNPLLYPKLGFDRKALEPIIVPAWVTHVIAVNPKATPTLRT